MKKLIFLVAACLIQFFANAQTFTLLNDTLINNTMTDSMYWMDAIKIIPSMDTGVIVVGYGDSINLPGGVSRLIVTSFDKNLHIRWKKTYPYFSNFGYISAVMDSQYNTFIVCSQGYKNSLIGISIEGNEFLNKQIDYSLSSTSNAINGISLLNGYLFINGNIFNTQRSFMPFISKFDLSGNLVTKKLFSVSSDNSSTGFYKSSLINISPEGNISFTYQLDSIGDYMLACYDPALNKIWSKTINTKLGYAFNLFNQGNKIVFINLPSSSKLVNCFKFDPKTGEGGNEVDLNYSFPDQFSMRILPTKNGKYLSFANVITANGFDTEIDYFDDNMLLYSGTSYSINSRTRISSACIIASYLYTVAIRFVDQYCYPQQSTGYRGMLRIKKYNMDFLNQAGVINQKESINGLKLYPNPASHELTLELNNVSSPSVIKIMNLLGTEVLTTFTSNSTIQLDVSSFPKGLYILQCDSDESVSMMKFVIE